MMNQLSLITVISVLLIGLSCARNEDTLKDYTVAGEKTGIDTSVPTIVSTNPTDGAKTVVSRISATFSEVMDHSSINSSSFTLKDASNNSISGSLRYQADNRYGLREELLKKSSRRARRARERGLRVSIWYKPHFS